MYHFKRLAIVSLLLGAGLCAQLAQSSSAAAASVTISPLPGTPTALPQTQISFLGASAKALRSISVVGSMSGRHSGHLHSYKAAAGASFVPSTPFTPGEQVSVSARWRAGKHTKKLSSIFTVAQPATIPLMEFTAGPGKPSDIQSFQSQPALHPPVVTVTHPASAASAPGYLFASPFLGPGQYGPMIFDNAGNVVWFRSLPAGEDAADFRTQVYKGKNDLTWWQGRTFSFGFGDGVDIVANANYKTVAVIKAGNGLQADEHEFLLTPQGEAFVLAYNPVLTSLASAGGPASGIALDGVIQEIDIHTGLVMWEWHSLGHVDVSESYSKPPGVATNPFDYFHINSLTTDGSKDLLISARNTSALYEIDARTGAVVWRLGGKKSTFTLGPGVAFAFQHNALRLPNGDISLFDDEGAPPVKPPSRGEVIKLDLTAKTATLVGQLIHAPAPLSTGSQGNIQSLPTGGWMVGWGGLPNLTEFDAAGAVVFDAQFPTAVPMGEFSYRVYREPWSGQPTEAPLAVAKTTGGTTAVYASWNGATTIASWQLLTGASVGQLAAVSTTPKGGFETVIPAPAAAVYEVRALSAAGKVLASSAPVKPTA